MLMAIGVALCVGFGLSYLALTDGRMFGASHIGPWAAWPDIGSPAPNPYTRAHLAREAMLPLGQAQGLRFTATTDSAGEPLTRACSYAVTGRTPTANFWSLVAIDADGVNIAVPDGDLAIRSSRIARTNSGEIVVKVGTTLQPGNWLELTGTGPFSLVMTLYDTPVFSGLSSNQAMPVITRGECA